MALFGGQLVEAEGFFHIHRYAPPLLVAHTQTALTVRLACVGGRGVPFHRRHHIARRTDAELVASAQVILGRGVAPLGGLLVQADGLSLVNGHADASFTADGVGKLSPLAPTLGGQTEKLHGTARIGGGTVAPSVSVTQDVQGLGMAQAGGVAIPHQGAGGGGVKALRPAPRRQQTAQFKGRHGRIGAGPVLLVDGVLSGLFPTVAEGCVVLGGVQLGQRSTPAVLGKVTGQDGIAAKALIRRGLGAAAA